MYKDANINLSVIDAVELGYDRDSYSNSQTHLSTVLKKWIAYVCCNNSKNCLSCKKWALFQMLIY